MILLLADGDSYATITAKTGCSSRTIALWRHRFEAERARRPPRAPSRVETDRYIKQYNKTVKPVRWAYADPTRRIA